jgi:hypothetical protein
MSPWFRYYWFNTSTLMSLIAAVILPILAAYESYQHDTASLQLAYGGIGVFAFVGAMLQKLLQYISLEWAQIVPRYKPQLLRQLGGASVIYGIFIIVLQCLWGNEQLLKYSCAGAYSGLLLCYLSFKSLGMLQNISVIALIFCAEYVPLSVSLGLLVGAAMLVCWQIKYRLQWHPQATSVLYLTRGDAERTLGEFLGRGLSQRGFNALTRWLHPLSFVSGAYLIGITFWIWGLPIFLWVVAGVDGKSSAGEMATYLAAVMAVIILLLEPMYRLNQSKQLQLLWLLPCYQGKLALRQAYVKAQWRFITLLLGSVSLFGIVQSLITPQLTWLLQFLHIMLLLFNCCVVIQTLGLFCRKDWQLGCMSVLVLTYWTGAFLGSLDVTWSTIALIDGMPLLLIQVFRYKAMTYFWQHGLQLA